MISKSTFFHTKRLTAPIRIDPKKNFLLSRASLITQVRVDKKQVSLYQLHNGNFATHTTSEDARIPDALVRVLPDQVLNLFGGTVYKKIIGLI